MATIPIGTLIQKIQCQLTPWVDRAADDRADGDRRPEMPPQAPGGWDAVPRDRQPSGVTRLDEPLHRRPDDDVLPGGRAVAPTRP